MQDINTHRNIIEKLKKGRCSCCAFFMYRITDGEHKFMYGYNSCIACRKLMIIAIDTDIIDRPYDAIAIFKEYKRRKLLASVDMAEKKVSNIRYGGGLTYAKPVSDVQQAICDYNTGKIIGYTAIQQ